jgi:hypothetical protein
MTDTTTTTTTQPDSFDDPAQRVFHKWRDRPLVQLAAKAFPADLREDLDALLFAAFEFGAEATLKALNNMMDKAAQECAKKGDEIDEMLKDHAASKPVTH